MEIVTFKPEEYRGCPVYIRRIGTLFEYLAVVKGLIYSANVEIQPVPSRAKRKNPYTPKELQYAQKYLAAMAVATIDSLLDGTREPKKKPKALHIREKDVAKIKEDLDIE
jgi:hypothetical protein